jgi:hypothetical protein
MKAIEVKIPAYRIKTGVIRVLNRLSFGVENLEGKR